MKTQDALLVTAIAIVVGFLSGCSVAAEVGWYGRTAKDDRTYTAVEHEDEEYGLRNTRR